jgi:hypothetical protein
MCSLTLCLLFFLLRLVEILFSLAGKSWAEPTVRLTPVKEGRAGQQALLGFGGDGAGGLAGFLGGGAVAMSEHPQSEVHYRDDADDDEEQVAGEAARGWRERQCVVRKLV